MVAHLGVSIGDGVDGGVVRRLREDDGLTRTCWGGLGTESLPASSWGGPEDGKGVRVSACT